MKSMTFLTEDDLHKEFKILCITSNIEMKEFLNCCMKQAVINKDFFNSIINFNNETKQNKEK